MEVIRTGLLGIHVAAGLAALHRRAGRWYTAAMTFITVTGFVLAAFFLVGERWRAGLFLLFLGVITGTSLWNGWRALRAKREPARYVTRAHVAVALLNVIGGLALIAFGISVKAPLFYAFGPVGLIIGAGMLSLARRSPDDPKYWLYEHFTGMIGSGIASHVAFLAFGGRQLFNWGQGGYGLLLWITPVVVGTVAITALNIYYRGRSAPALVRLTP